MQTNPYLIFGLSNDCNRAELQDAYTKIKKEYQEKIFCEGEEGANATKMLNQIEKSYNDCLDDLDKRIVVENFGNVYGEIETAIKNKDFDDAQSKLDVLQNRNAEWHYYQAMIYYGQGWFLESKSQLNISIALDEGNAKYTGALSKLESAMKAKENPQNQSQNQSQNPNANQQAGANEQRGGYTQPTGAGGASNTDACCNTCSSLICCDCCCECMGGDLISCC
ncbi:MAG: hypothetical protein RR374_02550 [Clostridia bacterium]